MPQLSGAQSVINSLKQGGVHYVFGIPGGVILPLYDVLYEESQPAHLLVRHEETAAFMADAYARVTGQPQVCLGTMGPGAQNLLIGVACAYSDSIPLLAITGNVSTAYEGRGLQQETDHVGIFNPVTIWGLKVTRTDRIPEIMRKAFRMATLGRPGPVLLDFPVDVLTQEAEMNPMRPMNMPPAMGRLLGDLDHIKTAAQLMMHAEQPLILTGGGVISANASDLLTKLAESLQTPVVTSYNGRGSIPEDHPLFLGRAGSGAPKIFDQIIREADVVLAIGYRFTDVSTNNWNFPSDNTLIIQVDIDPYEIERIFPVEIGIIGDARTVLTKLLEYTQLHTGSNHRRKDWVRASFQLKNEWERQMTVKMTSSALPIKPHRVMKELRDLLDRDAIIATTAGNNKMFVASLFKIFEPRTWIHSGGSTPMGAAFCHALGAQLAAPQRQVVAVCGDGGFQMVCQDLITAVENDLPVITCILNDQSLGLIRYQQKKQYKGRIFATEFQQFPDFVKLAEAFGATGIRVEKPADIKPALQQAIKLDCPVVLDIIIDKDESPQL
ncbi:MAG: biosynthetic-type acetolactate synthase large subunit [Candidatus Bathyarchaeota archaeon]|nr:MAG: biosynthetic-type acetolactate synthase large subunit [Candidatus Bathyarchaeota archaeon]